MMTIVFAGFLSNDPCARCYRWFVLAAILLLLPTDRALAWNWSQFRGPKGSGVAESDELPVKRHQDSIGPGCLE
jgi:hypothetical protein